MFPSVETDILFHVKMFQKIVASCSFAYFNIFDDHFNQSTVSTGIACPPCFSQLHLSSKLGGQETR